MNYYIQGDAAKADQIKAAFEKLGYEPYCWTFETEFYFTVDCTKTVQIVSPSSKLINIIKTHPDYKELELPVKPNFKVGDWIVQNDNGTVSQITKTINGKDEYGEYLAYEHTNGYFAACFENEYHLWTIADAKDGDILSAKIDGDDYILIFKQIKDGWIETYCHYYITIDKFCAPTQMFCRNYQGRLYPATQEQYRTLFKKMHDDGYEWDFDKKELKKIPVKPKFKTRDWVVRKDGKPFCGGNYAEQITLIEVDEKGKCIWLTSTTWVNDDDIRLWTIQDAKDGDVLVSPDDSIIIYAGKIADNGLLYYYVALNKYKTLRTHEQISVSWLDQETVKPATREQRDLLFKKMKEAGYQWDADKKELRKIQPHYDIANFYAGMPVLVRADNDCCWDYSVFSRNTSNEYWHFAVCNGVSFTQCIPFNDDTKHLLGTTDMCDEMYINW